MMKSRSFTGVSIVGFILVVVAIRWLITPLSHPSASNARTTGVWVTLVVGIVLLYFGLRRR
jgi:hypothetical protein